VVKKNLFTMYKKPRVMDNLSSELEVKIKVAEEKVAEAEIKASKWTKAFTDLINGEKVLNVKGDEISMENVKELMNVARSELTSLRSYLASLRSLLIPPSKCKFLSKKRPSE
jgi:hypothetical protein